MPKTTVKNPLKMPKIVVQVNALKLVFNLVLIFILFIYLIKTINYKNVD